MRFIFRSVSTIVFGILLALLYFTAETVADELGWVAWVRTAVKSGVETMSGSSYSLWLWWATIFTAGVSSTLWLDYAIRRFSIARSIAKEQLFPLRVRYKLNSKNDILEWVVVKGSRIEADACFPQSYVEVDPNSPDLSDFVTQFVIIPQNILPENPIVEVVSDRDFIWRLINCTPKFLVFEIDPLNPDAVQFEIFVHEQQEGYIPTEADLWRNTDTRWDILNSKSESPAPQSPQGTETEMPH